MSNFLKKHKIFSHIYTISLVLISFVIFNGNSLKEILFYLKQMFIPSNIKLINKETIYYIKSYGRILLIAIISSTPLAKTYLNKLKNKKNINIMINFLEPLILILALLINTAFLIDDSFNPFLYFRF